MLRHNVRLHRLSIYGVYGFIAIHVYRFIAYFQIYHIRCLLPDGATTFITVAALCISFISEVEQDLPPQCAIVHIDVTSTPFINSCSITVAPTSNSSPVALVHLAKFSPQTKWSNQFVCHQVSQQ